MSISDALSGAAGFFGGATLVFGAIASALWYRSATSRMTEQQVVAYLSDPAQHGTLAAWLVNGANLNRWAAIWTLLSVVSSALCTALDHMK